MLFVVWCLWFGVVCCVLLVVCGYLSFVVVCCGSLCCVVRVLFVCGLLRVVRW